MSDKTTENGHILIEFDENGTASFDVYTKHDEQIIIGMMGLEGYIAAKTGLDKEDIRELMDNEKLKINVKPKAIS